jgi:tetratricopeptide (TPR) repeat protein
VKTAALARGWRWIWAAAALFAIAGLAIGIGFWMRQGPPPAPSPPVVDLAGVDPALADAVRAVEQRVRASPQSASAWGLLGMTLLANDFIPEAQVCLKQAEALDPREPRWPYLQAGIDRWTNPEGEAKLRRTVELCGDAPPTPRLHLAEWLLSRERFEEAEAEFNRSLEAVPNNPWARLGLARAALERGDLQAALARLEASSGRPDSAAVATPRAYHDLRARIYQRQGEAQAADREARLAATMPEDPGAPDPFAAEVERCAVGRQARTALVDHFLREGRSAEALVQLQGLIRDYPEADAVWLRLARVLQARGDMEGAEKAARNAAHLAPASIENQYSLGLILFQKDKTADAAECFRRATELEPAFAPGYLSLGQCLDKEGNQPGAIAAFRAAIRYSPQVAAAQLGLAELLLRSGQKEEAAGHLRDAVRLAPSDSQAQKLLEQIDGAGPPGSEKK